MFLQNGHSYNLFQGSRSSLCESTLYLFSVLQKQNKSENLFPRETQEKSPSLMETCLFKPQKVLSHPQTLKELAQFHAQNNTEKQLLLRFSHSHEVDMWTSWKPVLGSKNQCRWKKRERHLRYETSCPLVSYILLHNDIIGHSSYLMGPLTKTDDPLAQCTPSPPALSAKYSIRVSE